MPSGKQSIGQKIKAARENARDGKGMSQIELAEMTGIKQASLSQIEKDKNAPRKTTLIVLSIVLNDDFGEDWLKEFFNNSVVENTKQFNHQFLENLLREADELDDEDLKEMKHIWEMLKSEFARRKKK